MSLSAIATGAEDGDMVLVLTCFEGADAVALAHDNRRRGRDGGEREVVREAVVVRLLRLPEEEARVEHRVVRLTMRIR